MAPGIKVKGIKELRRGFAQMDKSLRRDLDRGLREAAEPVRDEAKRIAGEKGLHDTGKLIAGIRIATAARGRVVVRSTAQKRGYKYPARYEYGDGGKRAFLQPALEAKRREIEERLGEMLDRLTR